MESSGTTPSVDETTQTSVSYTLELHDRSARGRIESIWQAIERDVPDLPLAATWGWTNTWLQHYGDIVPHRFATLFAEGRFVAVALLTRGTDEKLKWCGEEVWHLGTAGEADADSVCVEYNALACLPELTNLFLTQLMRTWQQDHRWDAIALDGFALDELPSWISKSASWQNDIRQARWIDLQKVRESGRELITWFGDSTRKNIRQSSRKLGQLRFEWAETVEHAQGIFTDLIRLHQARWNSEGLPGCYSSERFTGFHRELISQLFPHGQVHLCRLSNASGPIGCSQVIVDRHRALLYQGGRALEDDGSPGLVTDFLCMQECLHRGYRAFDFMAGDSLHKRRLTTNTTPLVWTRWQRPRWKYRLADTLRRGKALLKPRRDEPVTPQPAPSAPSEN